MALTRSPAYDNLIGKGNLKPSPRIQASIDQFLRVARDLLQDARLAAVSPHGQYLMAYEGIFSVVMAVLEHHESRPGDGEGHRTIAIQRVAADLELDPARFAAVTRLHAERNRSIYKAPIPPISVEQAALAVQLLAEMLDRARPLIQPVPAQGN